MTAAAEPVRADRAPKPGVRLTASTITDDQLDALYAERDEANERAWRALAQRQEMAAERYAWQERGDRAEAERDRYAAVLREVLGHFTQLGHPGEPCWRTGWVREETVKRWRAALDGPSEPRTAPTAALVSPVGLRDAQRPAGGPR